VSLEQDGGKDCYVRISLNSTEIDNCLHLLPQLGFTGVSVTSPLKRAVVQSNFTGCDRPLEAGNTLALIKGSFMLFDTDEEGFARELLELEALLPGRAPVLLFGDGGVTDALRRALAARGWTDVRVLPAREGWASAPATRVDVVINASGGNASAGAPECVAWIDVRYRDVDPPPPGVRLLRNGMTMYKHQALAQRRLWGLRGEETDFVSSF
jgi:shikimate 5-dehydrogenase